MGFGVIGKDQVIEQWSTMMANAAGNGDRVMEDTERLIQESSASNVKVQRRGMSPGMMRGIMGGKRSFIVITNTGSPNLKPFKMYLHARDYGSSLQVSWYVVLQLSVAEKLIAFLLSIPFLGLLFLPFYLLGRLFHAGQSGIIDLDIFDEQCLSAYVTNAHHCMLEAVDNLMQELKQDSSKIAGQSSGFLGVSRDFRDG